MSHPRSHTDVPARVDEAVPDLAALQQRDPDVMAVPVEIQGAVETHELPARQAPAFTQVLTDDLHNVVSADLRRKICILIGDDEWIYSHSTSAPGCRWPADVPLVLSHGDAIFARNHPDAAAAVNLSVIVEVWAD